MNELNNDCNFKATHDDPAQKIMEKKGKKEDRKEGREGGRSSGVEETMG